MNNRSKSINEFNNEELSLIIQKCKEFRDIESFLILFLIDTGCSFAEILGLDIDDIYLDSYLPFIIIRSNNLRKIRNLNRLRTVPLVGLSLWAIKKMCETNQKKK